MPVRSEVWALSDFKSFGWLVQSGEHNDKNTVYSCEMCLFCVSRFILLCRL